MLIALSIDEILDYIGSYQKFHAKVQEALKMLQSLLRQLNGIEKIDLQREIEGQASRLPAYLQRLLVTS